MPKRYRYTQNRNKPTRNDKSCCSRTLVTYQGSGPKTKKTRSPTSYTVPHLNVLSRVGRATTNVFAYYTETTPLPSSPSSYFEPTTKRPFTEATSTGSLVWINSFYWPAGNQPKAQLEPKNFHSIETSLLKLRSILLRKVVRFLTFHQISHHFT